MSYRISYGSEKDLIRFQKSNHYGLIVFAFIVELVVGIRVFLPDFFKSCLEFMNPLDEYGVQAACIMIENVRQGIPVGEAVDAFCRSIVENALLGN